MKIEQLSAAGGPTPADANYRFSDPKGLAKVVTAFMWIYFATGVLNVVVVGAETAALMDLSPALPLGPEGVSTGNPQLDIAAGLSRLVHLGVYIITGILFLVWTYRVVKNARVMTGGYGITAKPGWAVAWFFIPIAFLWKPFDNLRQAWQASTDPSAPASVPVPGFMRWWWGLWLTFLLLDNAAGRLTALARDVGTMVASNVAELASGLAALPLVFFVTRLLRELSARQVERGDVTVFD